MKKSNAIALVLAFFSLAARGQIQIEKVLEGVEIGMARAEFLELKKAKKAVPSGERRTEFFEPIGNGGLLGARFFFDNDGERFLYEIDLEFESEKAARQAAVAQFGQPNHPQKADFWVFDAFRGGATLGWIDGKKVVVAADLPETEWAGDSLFRIEDAAFLRQFEPPAPGEWSLVEWRIFEKSLEKQLFSAKNDFKDLRGGLVGEAGSGMVECLAPLEFSMYASVFQDEENRWTASNTMIEGCQNFSRDHWMSSSAALFDGRRVGLFRLKKVENLEVEGFDPADILRFSALDEKGQTAAFLEVAAFFLSDEEGWAIDFLVVKPF